MKIGIIGAGNIGHALALRFGAAGHEITIANSRGPETLSDMARETGAQAGTIEQAATGNDLVVIAIPMAKIADLPSGLFADAPAELIVVDTNNYYPRERDGRIAEIEAGLAESLWVENQIGHPVVKAFNMMIAQHIADEGKPAATVGRDALAIAGDDADAKATVMRLVDEIGFDAVDAGSITDSWRQQPGSPVYCRDYDAAGVRNALSEATKERPAEFTATPNSPGTYAAPA